MANFNVITIGDSWGTNVGFKTVVPFDGRDFLVFAMKTDSGDWTAPDEATLFCVAKLPWSLHSPGLWVDNLRPAAAEDGFTLAFSSAAWWTGEKEIPKWARKLYLEAYREYESYREESGQDKYAVDLSG